jgi:mediator of RNA polymerase II transcription subunit 26
MLQLYCFSQQTRIGKYVNDMRRKTSNRDLARRAKDLVKKWQQLYAPQQTVSTPASGESAGRSTSENNRLPATANGVRLPNAKSENGLCAKTASPAESVSSVRSGLASSKSRLAADLQSHSGSRPSTPVTVNLHPSQSVPSLSVAVSQSLRPSKTSVNAASRPVAKLLKTEQNASPAEKTKNSSSLSRPPSVNGLESAGYVYNEKSADPMSRLKASADNDNRRAIASVPNGSLKSYGTPSPSNGLWLSHSTLDVSNNQSVVTSTLRTPLTPDPSAAEAAQLRTVLKIKINRTSGAGSVSSPVLDPQSVAAPGSSIRKASKITVNRTSITGSVNSPVADSPSVVPSLRKVPKVETTAQLLKKMHANGELNLVNSETLNRIANNQIRHEVDTPQSIVPEGAKPRPHKRRRIDTGVPQSSSGPPRMTDADLIQVKAERVRNFLEMTAEVEPPTSVDNDLISLLPQLPQPSRFNELENAVVRDQPKPAASPELTHFKQESAIDNTTEPYQLPELPAIDCSSIDWYSNEYTVPDFRPAPSYADLERLHYGQWEGVNGQRDFRGEWADWTQTYSVRSYNNDLLHILPYVDITE